MTQLALSDELAATIADTASKRGCTPQELLEAMFCETETDEAYAERLLTPALQERMLRGLQQDQSQWTTSEEIDRKFEAFFRDVQSR